MPPINSLMSASSSTMRMSDAMGYSLFLLCGLSRDGLDGGGCCPLSASILGERFLPIVHRQVKAHRGPFELPVLFWRVGEMQRSAMLLGNALDDGKPQPSALGAGGHIGLDQAVPVLFGQAAAIVDHSDLHPVSFGAHHGHHVAGSSARGIGLDRGVDRL